jgi:hypothetical protein
MPRKKREPELPEGARELRERVEHWRQTRPKLGPMPTELWEAATALAAKHGVSVVSEAVGVAHNPLRQRVEALETGSGAGGSGSAPRFVEWQPPRASATRQGGETVVELCDERGRRMTVRTEAAAMGDMVLLVRALWTAR